MQYTSVQYLTSYITQYTTIANITIRPAGILNASITPYWTLANRRPAPTLHHIRAHQVRDARSARPPRPRAPPRPRTPPALCPVLRAFFIGDGS